MRSLALKLTLAFLLVGLTGTLLMATFVSQRTQSEFDRFVLTRYEADLVERLANYYETAGDWAALQTLTTRSVPARQRPLAQALRESATVLDADRRVVFSRNFPYGTTLPPREIKRAAPITVDERTVGWLLFTPLGAGSGAGSGAGPLDGLPGFRPTAGSPEANFLRQTRRAFVYGSLGALLLALALGAVLARTLTRPLRELTTATHALAQGTLGAQVTVRSADELGQLTASFNQMSSDLARATDARRQMTANIAHDLRTPLSVILGYTEALADGKIPGSAEVFGVMHGEAQQLHRLIDDLRTLSLADAGELSLQREPTPPRLLLERARAAHAPQAQAKGIDLQVEAIDTPLLDVDRARMAQLLDNLVGNALRHTQAGDQIVLSATLLEDRVVLSVRDTGEGIAAAALPHLFDRAYRVDAARSQSSGESGLGLAIVKSLIEAHGGKIEVKSEVGKGTIFRMSLPV